MIKRSSSEGSRSCTFLRSALQFVKLAQFALEFRIERFGGNRNLIFFESLSLLSSFNDLHSTHNNQHSPQTVIQTNIHQRPLPKSIFTTVSRMNKPSGITDDLDPKTTHAEQGTTDHTSHQSTTPLQSALTDPSTTHFPTEHHHDANRPHAVHSSHEFNPSSHQSNDHRANNGNSHSNHHPADIRADHRDNTAHHATYTPQHPHSTAHLQANTHTNLSFLNSPLNELSSSSSHTILPSENVARHEYTQNNPRLQTLSPIFSDSTFQPLISSPGDSFHLLSSQHAQSSAIHPYRSARSMYADQNQLNSASDRPDSLLHSDHGSPMLASNGSSTGSKQHLDPISALSNLSHHAQRDSYNDPYPTNSSRLRSSNSISHQDSSHTASANNQIQNPHQPPHNPGRRAQHIGPNTGSNNSLSAHRTASRLAVSPNQPLPHQDFSSFNFNHLTNSSSRPHSHRGVQFGSSGSALQVGLISHLPSTSSPSSNSQHPPVHSAAPRTLGQDDPNAASGPNETNSHSPPTVFASTSSSTRLNPREIDSTPSAARQLSKFSAIDPTLGRPGPQRYQPSYIDSNSPNHDNPNNPHHHATNRPAVTNSPPQFLDDDPRDFSNHSHSSRSISSQFSQSSAQFSNRLISSPNSLHSDFSSSFTQDSPSHNSKTSALGTPNDSQRYSNQFASPTSNHSIDTLLSSPLPSSSTAPHDPHDASAHHRDTASSTSNTPTSSNPLHHNHNSHHPHTHSRLLPLSSNHRHHNHNTHTGLLDINTSAPNDHNSRSNLSLDTSVGIEHLPDIDQSSISLGPFEVNEMNDNDSRFSNLSLSNPNPADNNASRNPNDGFMTEFDVHRFRSSSSSSRKDMHHNEHTTRTTSHDTSLKSSHKTAKHVSPTPTHQPNQPQDINQKPNTISTTETSGRNGPNSNKTDRTDATILAEISSSSSKNTQNIQNTQHTQHTQQLIDTQVFEESVSPTSQRHRVRSALTTKQSNKMDNLNKTGTIFPTDPTPLKSQHLSTTTPLTTTEAASTPTLQNQQNYSNLPTTSISTSQLLLNSPPHNQLQQLQQHYTPLASSTHALAAANLHGFTPFPPVNPSSITNSNNRVNSSASCVNLDKLITPSTGSTASSKHPNNINTNTPHNHGSSSSSTFSLPLTPNSFTTNTSSSASNSTPNFPPVLLSFNPQLNTPGSLTANSGVAKPVDPLMALNQSKNQFDQKLASSVQNGHNSQTSHQRGQTRLSPGITNVGSSRVFPTLHLSTPTDSSPTITNTANSSMYVPGPHNSQTFTTSSHSRRTLFTPNPSTAFSPNPHGQSLRPPRTTTNSNGALTGLTFHQNSMDNATPTNSFNSVRTHGTHMGGGTEGSNINSQLSSQDSFSKTSLPRLPNASPAFATSRDPSLLDQSSQPFLLTRTQIRTAENNSERTRTDGESDLPLSHHQTHEQWQDQTDKQHSRHFFTSPQDTTICLDNYPDFVAQQLYFHQLQRLRPFQYQSAQVSHHIPNLVEGVHPRTNRFGDTRSDDNRSDLVNNTQQYQTQTQTQTQHDSHLDNTALAAGSDGMSKLTNPLQPHSDSLSTLSETENWYDLIKLNETNAINQAAMRSVLPYMRDTDNIEPAHIPTTLRPSFLPMSTLDMISGDKTTDGHYHTQLEIFNELYARSKQHTDSGFVHESDTDEDDCDGSRSNPPHNGKCDEISPKETISHLVLRDNSTNHAASTTSKTSRLVPLNIDQRKSYHENSPLATPQMGSNNISAPGSRSTSTNLNSSASGNHPSAGFGSAGENERELYGLQLLKKHHLQSQQFPNDFLAIMSLDARGNYSSEELMRNMPLMVQMYQEMYNQELKSSVLHTDLITHHISPSEGLLTRYTFPSLDQYAVKRESILLSRQEQCIDPNFFSIIYPTKHFAGQGIGDLVTYCPPYIPMELRQDYTLGYDNLQFDKCTALLSSHSTDDNSADSLQKQQQESDNTVEANQRFPKFQSLAEKIDSLPSPVLDSLIATAMNDSDAFVLNSVTRVTPGAGSVISRTSNSTGSIPTPHSSVLPLGANSSDLLNTTKLSTPQTMSLAGFSPLIPSNVPRSNSLNTNINPGNSVTSNLNSTTTTPATTTITTAGTSNSNTPPMPILPGPSNTIPFDASKHLLPTSSLSSRTQSSSLPGLLSSNSSFLSSSISPSLPTATAVGRSQTLHSLNTQNTHNIPHNSTLTNTKQPDSVPRPSSSTSSTITSLSQNDPHGSKEATNFQQYQRLYDKQMQFTQCVSNSQSAPLPFLANDLQSYGIDAWTELNYAHDGQLPTIFLAPHQPAETSKNPLSDHSITITPQPHFLLDSRIPQLATNDDDYVIPVVTPLNSTIPLLDVSLFQLKNPFQPSCTQDLSDHEDDPHISIRPGHVLTDNLSNINANLPQSNLIAPNHLPPSQPPTLTANSFSAHTLPSTTTTFFPKMFNPTVAKQVRQQEYNEPITDAAEHVIYPIYSLHGPNQSLYGTSNPFYPHPAPLYQIPSKSGYTDLISFSANNQFLPISNPNTLLPVFPLPPVLTLANGSSALPDGGSDGDDDDDNSDDEDENGGPPKKGNKRGATKKQTKKPKKDKDKDKDADPSKDRALTKGLRYFAHRVALKMQEVGISAYNDLSDQIVQDMYREDSTMDPANVRRRTYDAFNVLWSLGLIEKDDSVAKDKVSLWRGSDFMDLYQTTDPNMKQEWIQQMQVYGRILTIQDCEVMRAKYIQIVSRIQLQLITLLNMTKLVSINLQHQKDPHFATLVARVHDSFQLAYEIGNKAGLLNYEQFQYQEVLNALNNPFNQAQLPAQYLNPDFLPVDAQIKLYDKAKRRQIKLIKHEKLSRLDGESNSMVVTKKRPPSRSAAVLATQPRASRRGQVAQEDSTPVTPSALASDETVHKPIPQTLSAPIPVQTHHFAPPKPQSVFTLNLLNTCTQSSQAGFAPELSRFASSPIDPKVAQNVTKPPHGAQIPEFLNEADKAAAFQPTIEQRQLYYNFLFGPGISHQPELAAKFNLFNNNHAHPAFSTLPQKHHWGFSTTEIMDLIYLADITVANVAKKGSNLNKIDRFRQYLDSTATPHAFKQLYLKEMMLLDQLHTQFGSIVLSQDVLNNLTFLLHMLLSPKEAGLTLPGGYNLLQILDLIHNTQRLEQKFKSVEDFDAFINENATLLQFITVSPFFHNIHQHGYSLDLQQIPIGVLQYLEQSLDLPLNSLTGLIPSFVDASTPTFTPRIRTVDAIDAKVDSAPSTKPVSISTTEAAEPPANSQSTEKTRQQTKKASKEQSRDKKQLSNVPTPTTTQNSSPPSNSSDNCSHSDEGGNYPPLPTPHTAPIQHIPALTSPTPIPTPHSPTSLPPTPLLPALYFEWEALVRYYQPYFAQSEPLSANYYDILDQYFADLDICFGNYKVPLPQLLFDEYERAMCEEQVYVLQIPSIFSQIDEFAIHDAILAQLYPTTDDGQGQKGKTQLHLGIAMDDHRMADVCSTLDEKLNTIVHTRACNAGLEPNTKNAAKSHSPANQSSNISPLHVQPCIFKTSSNDLLLGSNSPTSSSTGNATNPGPKPPSLFLAPSQAPPTEPPSPPLSPMSIAIASQLDLQAINLFVQPIKDQLHADITFPGPATTSSTTAAMVSGAKQCPTDIRDRIDALEVEKRQLVLQKDLTNHLLNSTHLAQQQQNTGTTATRSPSQISPVSTNDLASTLQPHGIQQNITNLPLIPPIPISSKIGAYIPSTSPILDFSLKSDLHDDNQVITNIKNVPQTCDGGIDFFSLLSSMFNSDDELLNPRGAVRGTFSEWKAAVVPASDNDADWDIVDESSAVVFPAYEEQLPALLSLHDNNSDRHELHEQFQEQNSRALLSSLKNPLGTTKAQLNIMFDLLHTNPRLTQAYIDDLGLKERQAHYQLFGPGDEYHLDQVHKYYKHNLGAATREKSTTQSATANKKKSSKAKGEPIEIITTDHLDLTDPIQVARFHRDALVSKGVMNVQIPEYEGLETASSRHHLPQLQSNPLPPHPTTQLDDEAAPHSNPSNPNTAVLNYPLDIFPEPDLTSLQGGSFIVIVAHHPESLVKKRQRFRHIIQPTKSAKGLDEFSWIFQDHQLCDHLAEQLDDSKLELVPLYNAVNPPYVPVGSFLVEQPRESLIPSYKRNLYSASAYNYRNSLSSPQLDLSSNTFMNPQGSESKLLHASMCLEPAFINHQAIHNQFIPNTPQIEMEESTYVNLDTNMLYIETTISTTDNSQLVIFSDEMVYSALDLGQQFHIDDFLKYNNIHAAKTTSNGNEAVELDDFMNYLDGLDSDYQTQHFYNTKSQNTADLSTQPGHFIPTSIFSSLTVNTKMDMTKQFQKALPDFFRYYPVHPHLPQLVLADVDSLQKDYAQYIVDSYQGPTNLVPIVTTEPARVSRPLDDISCTVPSTPSDLTFLSNEQGKFGRPEARTVGSKPGWAYNYRLHQQSQLSAMTRPEKYQAEVRERDYAAANLIEEPGKRADPMDLAEFTPARAQSTPGNPLLSQTSVYNFYKQLKVKSDHSTLTKQSLSTTMPHNMTDFIDVNDVQISHTVNDEIESQQDNNRWRLNGISPSLPTIRSLQTLSTVLTRCHHDQTDQVDCIDLDDIDAIDGRWVAEPINRFDSSSSDDDLSEEDNSGPPDNTQPAKRNRAQVFRPGLFPQLTHHHNARYFDPINADSQEELYIDSGIEYTRTVCEDYPVEQSLVFDHWSTELHALASPPQPSSSSEALSHPLETQESQEYVQLLHKHANQLFSVEYIDPTSPSTSPFFPIQGDNTKSTRTQQQSLESALLLSPIAESAQSAPNTSSEGNSNSISSAFSEGSQHFQQ